MELLNLQKFFQEFAAFRVQDFQTEPKKGYKEGSPIPQGMGKRSAVA